jgi:hypothetical protein
MLANLPFIIFLLSLLLLWAFLSALRRFYRGRKYRLPFTGQRLRAPGQSLQRQLDQLNEDIIITAVFLFFFPCLLYATYISQLYFSNLEVSLIGAAAYGGIGFVTVAVGLNRLRQRLGQRRRIRLGYDGEVAVGQELNQLMREGFFVYHDFPADGFNIDHILLGRKGVFVIETKARSKPTSDNRREDATVEYNGRVLYFPQFKDLQTIPEAERQAAWLSKWIGSAVAEPLSVRAVVALPGWFVKRTSAEGIPVVNPKQFPSLFQHIQPRELSEESIIRIAHQLDRQCRDVRPISALYDSAGS